MVERWVIRLWVLLIVPFLLSACQSYESKSQGKLEGSAANAGLYTEGLPGSVKWAVFPMMNFSENKQATSQLEKTLMVLLPSHGISNPKLYPTLTASPIFPAKAGEQQLKSARKWTKQNQLRNAGKWARKHRMSFALSGEVRDWRYDEQGVLLISVVLKVIDLHTGEDIWVMSGSREGKEVDSLILSRDLLTDMLQSLPVKKAL